MDNSYRENEGLPFTKQQLAAVLSSSEGKQLLSLLSRDGGAAHGEGRVQGRAGLVEKLVGRAFVGA